MLLLSSTALAAVVNTLSPSIGPPEEGHSASIGVGGGASFGNTEKTSISGGAGYEGVAGDHAWQVALSAEHTTVDGNKHTQNAFVAARYGWTFRDPWTLYGFVQADHNDNRSLILRDLVGAGIDRRLWRTEKAEAHLSATVMSEHQIHVDGVVDDDAGFNARGNVTMTHAFALDEGVSLTSVTYFQPRLDRPENWRVFEELVLEVSINERLTWSYSGTLEHDREPPAGVAATDVVLSSALGVSF